MPFPLNLQKIFSLSGVSMLQFSKLTCQTHVVSLGGDVLQGQSAKNSEALTTQTLTGSVV